jgi:hypothetical protein
MLSAETISALSSHWLIRLRIMYGYTYVKDFLENLSFKLSLFKPS